MNPPPRTLKLNIHEIESAFEMVNFQDGCCDEHFGILYLDLTTGQLVAHEPDGGIDEVPPDESHIPLPTDLFEDVHIRALNAFMDSLADHPLRSKLEEANRGRGGSRRFKNLVFSDVALKHRWHWFQTRGKRECIDAWLRGHNIEADWGHDIFAEPPLPEIRQDLLRFVLDFVRAARVLPGVHRISLMGSLATAKTYPKDIDLLVEVSDDSAARQSRKAETAHPWRNSPNWRRLRCGSFSVQSARQLSRQNLSVENLRPRHPPLLPSSPLRPPDIPL